MTTYAKSARPGNAAIAWATKDAIFVEIPSKSGPPYVARYARDVHGLAAALNIVIEHADQEPSGRSNFNVLQFNKLAVAERMERKGRKERTHFSEATKMAALEIVKKNLK